MEPIEHLKKEKKQLARLRQLRRDIYIPVAKLEVDVYSSKEPMPSEIREELPYRPIRRGGIWGGLFGCAWFRVRGKAPDWVTGRRLVVHINVGGEGAVYMGPEPEHAITSIMSYIDRVQSGVGKSVIEISDNAEGGQEIELYIDAGYNGYFNYPVGCGLFHYADLCVVDDELLEYYYDYLTIASQLSATEEPKRCADLEACLTESFSLWKDSIQRAREVLRPLFEGPSEPGTHFTAIGHSHLDLAWLWPMRETKRKAKRTFANQLDNAERYPDYIYGASQPWQFEYVQRIS